MNNTNDRPRPPFASNKPPVQPLTRTPGGLVIPITYDLEIKILFNTRTGTTELRLASETLKEFNTLQIAGVLSEHTTAMLRSVVSGSLKAVPVVDESKGANDGNQPQT